MIKSHNHQIFLTIATDEPRKPLPFGALHQLIKEICGES